MSVELLLYEERERIDAALDRLLPPADAWPQRLHEAMRYAVLGPGKRVRPILVRAACRAAGGDDALALEPGCALELIHAYSLIHDDLPALDDDTLRRGRPTVHVAFDEALAILAGDALLTEGFAVLARLPEGDAYASMRAEACRIVAAAVGSLGMVGGQVEDLAATELRARGGSTSSRRASPSGEAPGRVKPANSLRGRGEGGCPPLSEEASDGDRLERIHRAKTGALIGAAVELGALLGGAGGARRDAFRAFGVRLGLLFQIVDDILDATGTAASLGKSPGKDAVAGKLTYPAVHGLAAARGYRDELAAALAAEAVALEGEAGTLTQLVDFVARRDR